MQHGGAFSRLPPGKFTAYMHHMCGRVIQASPPDQLGLKIIDALDPRDNRVTGDPFVNVPPRYNGAVQRREQPKLFCKLNGTAPSCSGSE